MSTVIIIEDPPHRQRVLTTDEELQLQEQLKRDIEALREAGFNVVVHTPEK